MRTALRHFQLNYNSLSKHDSRLPSLGTPQGAGHILIHPTHGQHHTRYFTSRMGLPRKISRRDVCIICIRLSKYSNCPPDYDLVRAHHPDSPHCRSLSPSERHTRFQAITSAYDVLRGKSAAQSRFDPYTEEVARRKRAYYAHHHHNRRAEYAHASNHDWTTNADDRWKDRVILIFGVVVRMRNFL